MTGDLSRLVRCKGDPVSTVLITGGAGFLGSHCILQLLRNGHAERPYIRSKVVAARAAWDFVAREGGLSPLRVRRFRFGAWRGSSPNTSANGPTI